MPITLLSKAESTLVSLLLPMSLTTVAVCVATSCASVALVSIDSS